MKLRNRLWLVVLVALVLGGILLSLGASGVLRATVREAAERRLALETGLLETRAANATLDSLEALAGTWGRVLELRVTLIDAEGIVLAETAVSGESVAAMGGHAAREEIQNARATGWGTAQRLSATTGKAYFYCARRVDGSGPVKFLRLAIPVEDLESFAAHQLAVIVVEFALILLVVGVLVWLLVRRFTRPIEQIAMIAEQVANGATQCAIPQHEDEELARLGGSISRMQQHLLTQLSEKAAEEELLRTMMEGVSEGLLLVGADEKIVRANRAFCAQFAAGGAAVGRRLAEVVRRREVLERVGVVLRGGEPERFPLRSADEADPSYEVLLHPVQLSGTKDPAVLVLFFDISRLEALESMRRRFIADVSHELRTPITAIKGAVEVLLEGDHAPETRNFLRMAERQAERMAALVADLMDLSLMETGAVKLTPSVLNMAEVAREVLHAVQGKLDTARVRGVVDIPADLKVLADRRRMEQILTNLVDNAIKFNKPTGSVTLRARTVGAEVCIEVEDTGAGIPEASCDLVFQRFYRVDRSRERGDSGPVRAVGGTGLGLAITKHLVLLHGGRISVQSQLGVGSVFTIHLPAL